MSVLSHDVGNIDAHIATLQMGHLLSEAEIKSLCIKVLPLCYD